MTRPPLHSMVYWRYLPSVAKGSPSWWFGYVSEAGARGLYRMGRFNGDCDGGAVVDESEIEWRPYHA